MNELKHPEMAKYIDHTLLKPEATAAQIKKLCAEAKEYGFASVCVNSRFVRLVSRELRGSGVNTCAVVGFPLGAMSTRAKAYETKIAVRDGANEIDMVIDLGAARSGDWYAVRADIREVVRAAHPRAKVKVIIECCLLSDADKKQACREAKGAGADFVKTSTGFSSGGATVHDVELMRQTVGETMGVKAAGGIRSYEDAKKMIDAGATRIGASAGIAIVEG